jgi:predicted SAM-dependent methyltransferase
MKLNLGAGSDLRPKSDGWINIDVRQLPGIDIVLDLENKPLPFEDNSVDYVLCKDVLEHFSWKVTERVLKEMSRVLKQGGQTYVQVPNIDAIIEMYAKKFSNFTSFMPHLLDCERFSYWMFGGQDYPENAHKAGFNIPDLKSMLEKAGFEVINIAGDGGTNINCSAAKK